MDGREASADDADEDILAEGSYYLSKLGLSTREVASRFEVGEDKVEELRLRFEARLRSGQLSEDESALEFWKSIREEAEGNIKVTFVSNRGFHHAWRSDLAKLDGATLLSIFEACKDFLNMDASARFLEYDPPKNYDPLAMQREIAKSVVVVSALLEEKWKQEKGAATEEGGGEKDDQGTTTMKGRESPGSPLPDE